MLPVDASVEFLIVRLFGTSTSWAEARHDRNTDSKPTTTHRTRLCMANPPSESPRRCSRMHRLSTTYVYASEEWASNASLASRSSRPESGTVGAAAGKYLAACSTDTAWNDASILR